MKTITGPADRVIVAADYKPGDGLGRAWVRGKVLALADHLANTGVCIKVNSGLRACGYDLIDEIHERGLKVFADLKLHDITETLATDGAILREAHADFLTVTGSVGIAGLSALVCGMPMTDILVITVLTSLNDEDAQMLYGCTAEEAVMRIAKIGARANVAGFVSSPREASKLRSVYGNEYSVNTPGVRPLWSVVAGDDQNPDRVMTPAKAIAAGADRLVIGRPVVQASNPRDAVLRTIDEIASVLK